MHQSYIQKGSLIFKEHSLFFGFALLSLILRLAFWLYTGRIWEDALITLTPAQNLWDGLGLTHHPSEPRVHSFTSPISVLIPIIGELFNSGLLAIRIASLLSAVISIYFAYNIGRHLRFGLWAHFLILGYLSVDQLQIFFGMAGMETQVATAVILGGAYFLLKENWKVLGLMCGLALITRPEFVFFVGPVGAYVLIFRRTGFLKLIKFASLVVVPWYLFATIYYGSPIPNTVYAKTWGGKIGLFSHNADQIIEYLSSWWSHVAPYLEWSSVYKSPMPDILLKFIVLLSMILFAFGALMAVNHHDYKLIALIFVIALFFAYRTLATINSYFMWYLPPFLAIYFLVGATGLAVIEKKYKLGAMLVSILMVVSYGAHFPITLAYEKMVQEEIEYGVRTKVGKRLKELMSDSDSVFLEPLGYIGIEIRGLTVYDFPGLGSPKVIETIRSLPEVRMGGVIERLEPNYLVLRPAEIEEFRKFYPYAASKYTVIDHFVAREGIQWDMGSYGRFPWDTEFFILKRTN